MPQFKVADTVLHIECENQKMLEGFRDYQITQKQDSDLNIYVSKCQHIEEPRGKYIMGEDIKWFNKPKGENGYVLLGMDLIKNRVVALFDVNANFDYGCLYFDVNLEDYYSYLISFYVHNFPGMMFRYNILKRESIVVHASSINWNGKGLIFSAPSGTGKSTHVKLWQDYFGPEVAVVNDDTPALGFRGGQPFVFGTPWSGSGDNNNISAPLEAIIILEQASENKIRKLSISEALNHLMPRCFLPFFNESFMNLALANLERIIRFVPAYLLQCRPDNKAVEMVCQWVK